MSREPKKQSTQVKQILQLADLLGAHLNISHWAVSLRVSGKGDQIDRLMKGRDVNTLTAENIVAAFSRDWPQDLEWPAGIRRPKAPTKRRRNAA